MFRSKTVLVLGAGASLEVGLPVGSQLLQKIVELIDIKFEHFRQISGDLAVTEALKIHLNEGGEVDKLNAHLKAAWQLKRSATQALSIDNVIDALEDPMIEFVGKLGIVRAIHMAEEESTFFRSPENNPGTLDISKFKNTWYDSFTKILTENVKKSQILDIFKNLEIISFNYDRCLEQYLPNALSNYYGLPIATMRDAMKSLKIHRPYGIAGALPWQKDGVADMEFGLGSPNQLAKVATEIRTFTERVQEGEELDAMKSAISSADRIVFLGFAFHRQNVELIGTAVQPHTHVMGTVHGISGSDVSIISQDLHRFFGVNQTPGFPGVSLAHFTCNNFFNEYWRTLSS